MPKLKLTPKRKLKLKSSLPTLPTLPTHPFTS